MSENVFQMPSPLERLADRLRGYLTKEAINRQEWIEIQMGKCLTMAEMREQFSANIAFGRWCDANGFGETTINYDTRAAAIKMGRDPVGLRACLEASTRNSLLTIYREEFDRFRNVSKTAQVETKTENAPQTQDTRKKRGSPALDRALAAYDKLSSEGIRPGRDAIRREASVGEHAAQNAILLRTFKAEVPPPEPLPPAQMPVTMQQRYEAQLRAATQQLRKELKEEITAEISMVYDGYVRYQNNRAAKADRVLAAHKGVMSRATFRKIKACLHPDQCAFQFAAEALRLFSELEDVLVKPDELAHSGAPLPQTAAELMAWRKRYVR